MSERPNTETLVNELSQGSFTVSPAMAAWIVSKGDWEDGGYRVCRKDKSQKVSKEQIAEWFSTSAPRCLICGRKTELLTVAEYMRSGLR